MPLMISMIKRRPSGSLLFLSAAVFLLVLFACSDSGYRLDLIKSDGGWGYDVLVNKKLYIHQPYIPAVEGQRPFRDKRSARKTGKLVIRKLRNHKIPSVTKEELKEIIGN
jgi:hypothetical protein